MQSKPGRKGINLVVGGGRLPIYHRLPTLMECLLFDRHCCSVFLPWIISSFSITIWDRYCYYFLLRDKEAKSQRGTLVGNSFSVTEPMLGLSLLAPAPELCAVGLCCFSGGFGRVTNRLAEKARNFCWLLFIFLWPTYTYLVIASSPTPPIVFSVKQNFYCFVLGLDG